MATYIEIKSRKIERKWMNHFLPGLFVILFLFIGLNLRSQDHQYSQFTNLPIYYNPAHTGLERGMRLKFDYRRQWVNMPEDFKSMNFNMDIAARSIPGSGGIGIMFDSNNEGSGTIKWNSFALNMAVRIPIMDNAIAQLGVSASLVQKYIDWTRFVFTDQIDPLYGNVSPSEFTPPSSNKVNFPDFGVGGILRFMNETSNESIVITTIGFAANHLFEPNESFINLESNLPIKFVGTLDFQIQKEEDGRGNGRGFKYNPSIIYMNQGGLDSWSLGLNIYRFPLYVGMWYRSSEMQFLRNDAMIFLLGVNVNLGDNSRMKLIYSFDFLLSDLAKATGGSHEITIVFELDEMKLFGNKPAQRRGYNKSAREVECSSF